MFRGVGLGSLGFWIWGIWGVVYLVWVGLSDLVYGVRVDLGFGVLG